MLCLKVSDLLFCSVSNIFFKQSRESIHHVPLRRTSKRGIAGACLMLLTWHTSFSSKGRLFTKTIHINLQHRLCSSSNNNHTIIILIIDSLRYPISILLNTRHHNLYNKIILIIHHFREAIPLVSRVQLVDGIEGCC